MLIINMNDFFNKKFSRENFIELIIQEIIIKLSIKYKLNYYELIDLLKNKKNII